MHIVPRLMKFPSAGRLAIVLGASLLFLSAGFASAEEKVLARVNGSVVTQAQVEEALAGQLLQLKRQHHDMIDNGVRAKVQEILIEQAAKKKGVTSDEYIKAEVEGKAGEIPAEQVQAFYTPRAGQIRQPLEQVDGQIRQFLAYQAMVSALEADAKIEILTEPFRIDVPAVGPSKGPADAPVVIVEFGDFECPPCGRSYATIKQVRETYPEKVRVVFRQFPLNNIHPHAQKAAEASLCANDQGKFWEIHDHMFENQQKLAVEDLKEAAGSIEGLDAEAFASCLEGGKHAEAVGAEVEAGGRLGVGGTPTFFVNGRLLPGLPSFEDFVIAIDIELKKGS